MLNWLWAVAPPFAFVGACSVLYQSIVVSAQRGDWILLVAMVTGQALLAGWAGWRVVRRRAGGRWAAALAGSATQLVTFSLIGFAVAKGAPVPSGSEAGGLALLAVIAAAPGLVGGTLASIADRRHAT